MLALPSHNSQHAVSTFLCFSKLLHFSKFAFASNILSLVFSMPCPVSPRVPLCEVAAHLPSSGILLCFHQNHFLHLWQCICLPWAPLTTSLIEGSRVCIPTTSYLIYVGFKLHCQKALSLLFLPCTVIVVDQLFLLIIHTCKMCRRFITGKQGGGTNAQGLSVCELNNRCTVIRPWKTWKDVTWWVLHLSLT